MSFLIDAYRYFAGDRALHALEARCADPSSTQRRLLLSILQVNRDTRYGRRHAFGALRTLEQFRSQVPITTYDDLKGYIERAMNGEGHQLTAEAPFFYATTSGTTGPIKYIPITRAGHTSRAHLMNLWHFAAMRDHPRMFDEGMLTVVSPALESFTPTGVPRGAESGRRYRATPAIVRRKFALPYETFEIKDFEAKYYCIARLAGARKVSYLYTCNPSTLLIIGKSFAENTERIIRDVRDGTLSRDFDYGKTCTEAIASKLKPNRARARSLEAAAARGGGALLPRNVWPELELIACWKGGTLGQYLERFGRYFSPATAIRDIGYFASEFFGSIPMSDAGSDGVLSIDGNFYEFFPADLDRDPSGRDLVTADALEPGRRYLIYVTSQSGLYRYDMNDIVEVCGALGRTPLIRFVQKRKGITSLTGEKLSESQVIAAMDASLSNRRQHCDFIAAVGELVDDVVRYSFLVEFEVPPPDEDCRQILRTLDRELRRRNAEYHAKRGSGRIAHAALRVIKDGEFTRYRKRKVEAGQSDGVFKILRLTTDPRFAGEFATERVVLAEDEDELASCG